MDMNFANEEDEKTKVKGGRKTAAWGAQHREAFQLFQGAFGDCDMEHRYLCLVVWLVGLAVIAVVNWRIALRWV